MPRPLREAYVAPYDSWDHRIAIHRFVQDIPLRPGDRCYDLVTWVRGPARPARLGAHADRLGDEGLRLRPPLPRRVGPPVPQAEVHRFAQAGHYVLEDEAESIIALVQSFLAARLRGGANMMSSNGNSWGQHFSRDAERTSAGRGKKTTAGWGVPPQVGQTVASNISTGFASPPARPHRSDIPISYSLCWCL